MELKQVLQKLKKNWKIVAISSLLGLVLSGVYLYFRPKPIYEASALFFVTRRAQEPREDYYTYDGFHAQQAAYHYTDTLVGLAREMKADKVIRKSEQLVEVGLAGKNIGEAELAEFATNLVKNFNKLAQAGDPEVKLLEVEGFRKIEEVRPNTVLVLLVGFLGGLGVGVFSTAIKEYLS